MQRIEVTIVLLISLISNATFSPQFPPVPRLKPMDFNLNPMQIMEQWNKFKNEHGKHYTLIEEQVRFGIFKDNLKKMLDYNQKYLSGLIHYHTGINQFTDLTKNEFVNDILKLSAPQYHRKGKRETTGRIPRQASISADWRQRGAVTKVKNQGNCGSCWSFSALGSLEGQYYLKTGNLVSLSEQNLLDCAGDQVNKGCKGGWMSNAFDYIKQHWVSSEDSYPYFGQQQQCQLNAAPFHLTIQGYQTVQPNEEVLKQAVDIIGPIAAAMDASNLQFYAGGVFRDDDCIPGYVNHGILVIGYGTESGRDYWLVKNSWGDKWGEDGYFKMIRNKENQCNIASYGMFPIL